MALDISELQNLPVFLTLADGGVVTIDVGDLDISHYLYPVTVSINYGAQLGAVVMLILVVGLMTRPSRRKTPMFALNVLALFINFIKLLLGLLYFTGPFYETYIYFTQDYSLVPRSAHATAVAAVAMNLLLVICLVAALMLHIYVLLVTMSPRYKQLILGVSVAVSLATIGFRFAFAVINARAILTNIPDGSFSRITTANTYVTSIAVLWFSSLLTCRLGFVIWRRSSLGIQRMGAMENLFIMAGQTMIIPATFAILQLCPTGIPVMDTNVLTCVTLFLPLSSLWASVSNENNHSKEIELVGVSDRSDRTISRLRKVTDDLEREGF